MKLPRKEKKRLKTKASKLTGCNPKKIRIAKMEPFEHKVTGSRYERYV